MCTLIFAIRTPNLSVTSCIAKSDIYGCLLQPVTTQNLRTIQRNSHQLTKQTPQVLRANGNCVLCIVYCITTAHCALYTVHCALRSAYCILCCVHSSLYIEHTLWCTVHRILCTVYCAQYTVYCTLSRMAAPSIGSPDACRAEGLREPRIGPAHAFQALGRSGNWIVWFSSPVGSCAGDRRFWGV